LPDCSVSLAIGGSGAWVQGPAGLDASALAQAARARGVLIEPGAVFYARPTASQNNRFRMGYSAIAGAAIEAGVRQLGEARLVAGL